MVNKKLYSITPKFVETIEGPVEGTLEHGVVYISEMYEVAIFGCPCGCGLRTVIPFKPGEQGKKEHHWKYWRQGNIVSFEPSMLNKNCPNKSHWYITSNRIEWH